MLLALGSQVATPANQAAFSVDGGATFNQCTVPALGAAGWFGAAYSPSLGYGIMVSALGTVVRSFDGITWTAMPGNNLTNGNWQAGVVRTADDSQFVTLGIGGVAGQRCSTSPDGANWTLRNTPNVAAEGASFGTRILVMPDGTLLSIAGASTTRSFIASVDNGVTWNYTRVAGLAVDTSDMALREGTNYVHLSGFTGANAGDTFFTTDLGATLTRSLRDAVNDPPNCTAIAIDPVLGHVYQASAALGIWRGVAGDQNNPPNNGWTQVYAAGNVGSLSRGGWISQLQKIIFCTPAGGGFSTHQMQGAAWTTNAYPALLPGTARVKLDFLGFAT